MLVDFTTFMFTGQIYYQVTMGIVQNSLYLKK
jgi:hypothetical protein